MTFDYTPSELMAVAGARELQDRQVVAVGLGLPVVASFLAKLTHAPNMTVLFELGVINPQPIHTGVGLADPRVWYQAEVLSSFVDILGSILHAGRVDVGFLGGLETDKYGNLNTTLVGDPRGKFRHMVGSGGANDIASCAQRTVIIIRHEAHKLQEAIGFITSPGYLTGGNSRQEAGLRGGPSRVITNKAIFKFDDKIPRDGAAIHSSGQHRGGRPPDYGVYPQAAQRRAVHRPSLPRTGSPDPRGDRSRADLHGMKNS